VHRDVGDSSSRNLKEERKEEKREKKRKKRKRKSDDGGLVDAFVGVGVCVCDSVLMRAAIQL
jgi:hypothetical protein